MLFNWLYKEKSHRGRKRMEGKKIKIINACYSVIKNNKRRSARVSKRDLRSCIARFFWLLTVLMEMVRLPAISSFESLSKMAICNTCLQP